MSDEHDDPMTLEQEIEAYVDDPELRCKYALAAVVALLRTARQTLAWAMRQHTLAEGTAPEPTAH